MTTIKQIPATDTYAVRLPVLRLGKPIESCAFAGDDLATTIHFGIYTDNSIAGCLSVFKESNDIFDTSNQYQLRGMAVLEQHQKKGFGRLLIAEAEQYIKTENGKLIWLNARENAVVFYKNMGYSITGNAFIIEGIGTHYVMAKHL